MTENAGLRDFNRGVVIGVVLMAAFAAGAIWLHDGAATATLQAQLAAQADSTRLWKDSSAHHGVRASHFRSRLNIANAENAQLKVRVHRQVATVRQQAAGMVVAEVPATVARVGGSLPYPIAADSVPADRFMVPGSDTTRISTVQRQTPDGGAWVDSKPWLVPTFVLAAYQGALGTIGMMEGLIAQQHAAGALADSAMDAMARQRQADAATIVSVERERDLWKSKRSARCGRKCGILLGVSGTLAVAWTADKVFGVLRAPSAR